MKLILMLFAISIGVFFTGCAFVPEKEHEVLKQTVVDKDVEITALKAQIETLGMEVAQAVGNEKVLNDAVSKNLPVEFRAADLIVSEKFEEAFTTVDIVNVTDESAKEYDRLMNAFYQKLLEKIDEKDQEIVRQSQRDWVKFRDSEMKLNGVLSQDKYGGGTIQSIYNNSNYMQLVKERALEIYNHYKRVST